MVCERTSKQQPTSQKRGDPPSPQLLFCVGVLVLLDCVPKHMLENGSCLGRPTSHNGRYASLKSSAAVTANTCGRSTDQRYRVRENQQQTRRRKK
eukprot:scaffold8005_cov275-Amphora_coffeaeformis.AAC.38